MHDFLLAKEIATETLRIIKEKNFSEVKKVFLEIGNVSLAHGRQEKHAEEINTENLLFGIKSITQGTILEGAEFNIKRTNGETWKLASIDGQIK
jgi:Zn finger protein HypA/HybF involved in hydrogenase expression